MCDLDWQVQQTTTELTESVNAMYAETFGCDQSMDWSTVRYRPTLPNNTKSNRNHRA